MANLEEAEKLQRECVGIRERVYAGMNAKCEKGKLCAITLGLLTALLAGCVSTGAGTMTIDPPAPPGLPKPPPVTVPTPGTR